MTARRLHIAWKIAIATAAIILIVAAILLLSLGAAFNKEAALCSALNSAGVDADALSAILDDAIALTQTLQAENIDGEALASNIYSVSFGIARNKSALTSAIDAYASPPAVGNIFDGAVYLPLLNKLNALASLLDFDASATKLSEAQIVSAAKQAVLLCDGIVAAGKHNLQKAIAVARDITLAEDIFEEIPIRSLIEVAFYAIEATSRVDFSQLTLLDALTYDGFCTANARGINSVASALRSMTYDDLLALTAYLPQAVDFSVAVCNAAAVRGADIQAVGYLLADILDALYAAQDLDISADSKVISDALAALSGISPDDLTDEQRAQALPHVAALKAAFGAILPDISFFRYPASAQ